VGGDVIRLVAFDLVLGILFRCVMKMTLVVEVTFMDRDHSPGYPARLGIPGYMITNPKSSRHVSANSDPVGDDLSV
jgi:hypothetical protein